MFCSCGTVITVEQLDSVVKCRRCEEIIPENKILEMNIKTEKIYEEHKEEIKEEKTAAKIKKECVKCGNDEMLFNTAQLRSADEGQTVFYKCEKCGYKETTQS
ncbi:rpa12 [Nucleospora cyclopteri]